MRKWILKGTTLMKPFHIALFRMNFRSHWGFFQGQISTMLEIRADLFLAISKTGMFLLTSSVFKRFTIWFPADEGFSAFLKLVKISYDSD